MTTIYLIRHSVKLSSNNIETNGVIEDKNIKDEKTILSIEGERRAQLLSLEKELQNIDVIYSSSMVRSIATAKYLSNNKNLKINIDSRLNERRYGKQNSDEFPDWFERQYLNKDFKTEGGESQVEVSNRFHEVLNEILEKYNGKRIAIFTHGYAITFSLLKWCKLEYIDNNRRLKLSFNNKIIFDKVLNAPEVFKLEFDNNMIKNIELIEFDDLPYMFGGN